MRIELVWFASACGSSSVRTMPAFSFVVVFWIRSLTASTQMPPVGLRHWTLRSIVLWRCVLAAAAVAMVLMDPSKHGGMVWLTYVSLGFYSVYAVFLAIVSYRLGWPVPPRLLHWADAAFYAFLLSQADGAHSMFFLLFLYPILVASFCWGLREGLLVTAMCCALYVTISIATAVPAGTVRGYTLIAACYLFAFGYMISWLGGYERLLWRRLALLKEINNLWSPRFGVDHVHGKHLDRLLEYYDGTSCALVLRRPSPALNYVMYSAARGKPGQSATPATVTESVAGALLSLPDSLGAFYHDPAGSWRHRFLGYFAYDFDLRVATDAFRQDCAAFANLLDTQAFVTVPYAQRDGTTGRIFLTNPRPGLLACRHRVSRPGVGGHVHRRGEHVIGRGARNQGG